MLDGRVVDIYIKVGDFGLYYIMFVFVLDYDIVVNVMIVGKEVIDEFFV